MNLQKETEFISITKENPKQKLFNKCSEISTDIGREALKNKCFEVQMTQTYRIIE